MRLAEALDNLALSISKMEVKDEPKSFLSEGITFPSILHNLPGRPKVSFSESSYLSSRLAAQRAALDADFRRLETLKVEIEKQREKQIDELRQLTSTKPKELSVASQMKKIADLER